MLEAGYPQQYEIQSWIVFPSHAPFRYIAGLLNEDKQRMMSYSNEHAETFRMD